MTLKEHLDSLEPRIIQSIQESVGIPSVEGTPEPGMPFGKEVARALDHALNTAESMGFTTVNREGMIGYAEHGEGSEMIAILGHLDVVPEGEGWTHPPYGGEIHDGVMYGRGVMDDKGPIIGSLWSLKAIKDLRLPLKRRIRVIFGTNEESGMKGAAYYAKHEEAPLMGFTPDGGYPIINVEKGGLGVEAKAPFVADSQVVLKALNGGTVVNAVPEEAMIAMEVPDTLHRDLETLKDEASRRGWDCTLQGPQEDCTLTVRGKSAHGSTPELGENAITRMLVLLGTLGEKDSFFKFCQNLGALFHDDPQGKKTGIAAKDDISGALTCNVGLAHWDNPTIILKFDIRHPIKANPKDLLRSMESVLNPLGFDLAITKQARSVHVPADSELIRTLQKVYTEETGEEATLLAIGGGTYAKALNNIVAFGPTFPGEASTIHQPNERCSVAQLMRSIKIAAMAMYELAK